MSRVVAVLTAMVVGLLVAACGDGDSASESGGQASAGPCDLKIAELDSPDVHASYYAIDKGLVKDDRVGAVEVDYLSIPALVQNAGSDRYDVTSAALNGIVLVRQATGEDFRVIAFKQALGAGSLAMWVPADATSGGVGDLGGKTIGVSGLGSTNVMAAQILLENKYGVDASVNDGDVKFTDLDPPTLLNALKKGQVDSALFIHYPNWQARGDDEIEQLMDVSREYKAEYGYPFIGAGLIVSPDTIEAKRDCIEGLQKLLKESAKYAHDHIDKVAPAVTKELKARQQDVPTEYLEYWFDHNEYGSSLDPKWQRGADVFWEKAAEMELIPEAPKAADVVLQPGT